MDGLSDDQKAAHGQSKGQRRRSARRASTVTEEPGNGHQVIDEMDAFMNDMESDTESMDDKSDEDYKPPKSYTPNSKRRSSSPAEGDGIRAKHPRRSKRGSGDAAAKKSGGDSASKGESTTSSSPVDGTHNKRVSFSQDANGSDETNSKPPSPRKGRRARHPGPDNGASSAPSADAVDDADSDTATSELSSMARRDDLLSSLRVARENLAKQRTPDGKRVLKNAAALEIFQSKLDDYIRRIEQDRKEQVIAVAGNNGDGKSELLQFILKATEETPRTYTYNADRVHPVWNAVKTSCAVQSHMDRDQIDELCELAKMSLSSETIHALGQKDVRVVVNTPENAQARATEVADHKKAETDMYSEAIKHRPADIVNFILPRAMEKSATTTNCIEIRYGSTYALQIVFMSREDFVSMIRDLYESIQRDTLEKHRQSFDMSSYGRSQDDSDDEEAGQQAQTAGEQREWTSLSLLQYLLFHTTTGHQVDTYRDVEIKAGFDPDNIQFRPEILESFGTVQVYLGQSRKIVEDRLFIREAMQTLTPERDGAESPLTCIVEAVTLFCPSALLRDNRILLDLPGFNDDNPLRKAELSRGLERADVILALIRRSWDTAEDTKKELRRHEVSVRIRNARQRLLVVQCNEKSNFKNAKQIVKHRDSPETRDKRLNDELREVYRWLYGNLHGSGLNKAMEERNSFCKYLSTNFFLGGCLLRNIQGKCEGFGVAMDGLDEALNATGAIDLLTTIEGMCKADMMVRVREWMLEDLRIYQEVQSTIAASESATMKKISQSLNKETTMLVHETVVKDVHELLSKHCNQFWKGQIPDCIQKLRTRRQEIIESIDVRKLRVDAKRRGLERITRGRTHKLNSELRKKVSSFFDGDIFASLEDEYNSNRQSLLRQLMDMVYPEVEKNIVAAADDKKEGSSTLLEGLKANLRKQVEAMLEGVIRQALPRQRFHDFFSESIDDAIRNNSFRNSQLNVEQAIEDFLREFEQRLQVVQVQAGKDIVTLIKSGGKSGMLGTLLSRFFQALADPNKTTKKAVQQIMHIIERFAVEDETEHKDVSPDKYILLRERAGMESIPKECTLGFKTLNWNPPKDIELVDLSSCKHDAVPFRLKAAKASVALTQTQKERVLKLLKSHGVSEKAALSFGSPDYVSALANLFRVNEGVDRSAREVVGDLLVKMIGPQLDDETMQERIQRANTIEVLQAFANLYVCNVIIHDMDNNMTYLIRGRGCLHPVEAAFHFVVHDRLLFAVLDPTRTRTRVEEDEL